MLSCCLLFLSEIPVGSSYLYPQYVGSVTGPEARLFHSAHHIGDVSLPPSGKLTQEALLLLLMFNWSATRAGKWPDNTALVSSHLAPSAAVPREHSQLEWCQVDVLNFRLWATFAPLSGHGSFPSSAGISENGRYVCVYNRCYDFCIYTQLFVIQCSRQHLSLGGPRNVPR